MSSFYPCYLCGEPYSIIVGERPIFLCELCYRETDSIPDILLTAIVFLREDS